MDVRFIAAGVLAALASTAAYAGACNQDFSDSLARSARVVNSLRPEKPGVLRVFAADGTGFTGGQALWLKGQLRAIEGACAREDAQEAGQRLAAIEEVLGRKKER
jgi:hypothetical protein